MYLCSYAQTSARCPTAARAEAHGGKRAVAATARASARHAATGAAAEAAIKTAPPLAHMPVDDVTVAARAGAEEREPPDVQTRRPRRRRCQ